MAEKAKLEINKEGEAVPKYVKEIEEQGIKIMNETKQEDIKILLCKKENTHLVIEVHKDTIVFMYMLINYQSINWISEPFIISSRKDMEEALSKTNETIGNLIKEVAILPTLLHIDLSLLTHKGTGISKDKTDEEVISILDDFPIYSYLEGVHSLDIIFNYTNWSTFKHDISTLKEIVKQNEKILQSYLLMTNSFLTMTKAELSLPIAQIIKLTDARVLNAIDLMLNKK